MTAIAHQSVVPLAHGQPSLFIGDHISLSRYLFKEEPEPAQPDGRIVHDFSDNPSIWQALFEKRLVYGSRVKLKDSLLFEWFPRSPGLFHTDRGKFARDEAENRVLDVNDGIKIYDPTGKASMLEGGVGNVRLRPIVAGGREICLMTASCSPVCHEGFPIAVPIELYGAYIEQIADRGALRCSLTGRIAFVPKDLESLYGGYSGVPKFYLQVDDITPLPASSTHYLADLEVSAAAGFAGVVDGKPGTFITYASFHPGSLSSRAECTKWMEHYAVNMYRGRILTDFDEIENHFDSAVFSLDKVMSFNLSQDEVKAITVNLQVDTIFAEQLIIEQAEIREAYQGAKYAISGGQQGTVGDNAVYRSVVDGSLPDA